MASVSVNEGGQTAESITTIIRAHIKPDKEQEYEQWLHGINEDATRFGGFQGATILRPGDESHGHPEYVVVVRFATYSDLRRWEHSTQFNESRRRLEPLLVGNLAADTLTGMETWFTLPGHTVVAPPPRYKMAVVASLGAAPFVLVVIPLPVQYLHGVLLREIRPTFHGFDGNKGRFELRSMGSLISRAPTGWLLAAEEGV